MSASRWWAALRFVWGTGRGRVATYLLGALATGLLPVLGVWLFSSVAEAVAQRDSGRVAGYGAAVVVCGLATAILPSLLQYLTSELNRVAGRTAQADLYAATDRLEGLAAFEDPRFRDRLRLAQFGGRTAPSLVVDGTCGLAQGCVTVVGMALVLVRINAVVTAVAVAAALPALVGEIRVSRARADVLAQVSPMERREFFYSDLLTSLDAAKEVRLLGLGGLFRIRMLHELGTANDRRRGVDRREMRIQGGLGLLTAAVSGAGLWWALTTAGTGPAAVGAVVAYLAAIGGLQSAVSTQVSRVASLHQALTLFGHFADIAAMVGDLPAPEHPQPLAPLRHGIELRDVWFRYGPDSPWVLRGVDLVIPHGTSLAVVGLNGAGKSTLVKLLCRFYDPTRGQILWDGVDVRDVPVRDLRDRIGAVFQDFMTYDLTAAENVGIGDVARLGDRVAVQRAARRAGVDGVLDGLPDGYDTLLSRSFCEGEEDVPGVLLSGGQWQRLALARAMMRVDRDLLVLDEPSAGLDAHAEHEVHRHLRRHRAGATSVLISHRLGSLRDADRIVVLAGGRITESGRHDELAARRGGAYAELFRVQADGYRDDRADAEDEAARVEVAG